MIVDENVGLIITVARESENGKEKFFKYWPDDFTDNEDGLVS